MALPGATGRFAPIMLALGGGGGGCLRAVFGGGPAGGGGLIPGCLVAGGGGRWGGGGGTIVVVVAMPVCLWRLDGFSVVTLIVAIVQLRGCNDSWGGSFSLERH